MSRTVVCGQGIDTLTRHADIMEPTSSSGYHPHRYANHRHMKCTMYNTVRQEAVIVHRGTYMYMYMCNTCIIHKQSCA